MRSAIFVPVLTLAIGFLIGFFPIYSSQNTEITSLKNDNILLKADNTTINEQLLNLKEQGDNSQQLEAEISRLLLTSASGGGVNLKMMPHPETKELTVELPEVFSFNANHAFCRVDTNREAFVMQTYAMGEVLMGPNEFFMSMSTTSIDDFKVSVDNEGRRRLLMTGGLDCFTEVAKANLTLGSRDIAEPASYKIEAIDAGLGGGLAGDSFAFTVFFDAKEAPFNYAIFGPEFTFTGTMTDGEVTIPNPR